MFMLILGAHYLYLGRVGLQILFWVTLGGFGLWLLIDLFRVPDLVNEYNMPIYEEMEEVDRMRMD